jgi:hypothetical protein
MVARRAGKASLTKSADFARIFTEFNPGPFTLIGNFVIAACRKRAVSRRGIGGGIARASGWGRFPRDPFVAGAAASLRPGKKPSVNCLSNNAKYSKI